MTPAATKALQDMLAGEHAAVYAYGLLGGRLAPGTRPQTLATEAYLEHRTRRDDVTALLIEAEADPVAAEPAYELPTAVDTPAQAAAVARRVEDRCSVLYAQVVAAATGGTRAFGVDALLDAATRALTWGAEPVAFPGVQRR